MFKGQISVLEAILRQQKPVRTLDSLSRGERGREMGETGIKSTVYILYKQKIGVEKEWLQDL